MSKHADLQEEVAKIVAFARSCDPAPDKPMTINGNHNIQVAGGGERPMTITGHRNLQINGPASILRRFFKIFRPPRENHHEPK